MHIIIYCVFIYIYNYVQYYIIVYWDATQYITVISYSHIFHQAADRNIPGTLADLDSRADTLHDYMFYGKSRQLDTNPDMSLIFAYLK